MKNTREALRQASGRTSIRQIAADLDIPQSSLNKYASDEDVPLGVLVAFCRRYNYNLITLLVELDVITSEEAGMWKNEASVKDFQTHDLTGEVHRRAVDALLEKRARRESFGLAAKRGDERIGKDQLPDWD